MIVITSYSIHYTKLYEDALAAAYAENGNFGKAVKTAQKALELALQLGPEEHIIGLKKRLKLYQAGQPYRQNLKQKDAS